MSTHFELYDLLEFAKAWAELDSSTRSQVEALFEFNGEDGSLDADELRHAQTMLKGFDDDLDELFVNWFDSWDKAD